jgi:rSAM/selenodomain-associated transferase 2
VLRLTVIIPALNEADAIGPLLDDLAPARAQGARLLVVDGGSHDGTPDVAARHGAEVVDSPRGRARQLRAGVDADDRPWLWFVHADCRVPAGAAGAVASALEVGPWRWGRFDVRFTGMHPALRMVAAAMNLRSRLTGIATGDQGIFVERAALAAIGGVPDQPLMEDVELSRRLKVLSRPRALSLALTTSSRRWERDGITRTVLLMWWLRLRYFAGASPAGLARVYYPPREP